MEPRQLRSMGEHACQRGAIFSREVFAARVKEIFAKLLNAYRLNE